MARGLGLAVLLVIAVGGHAPGNDFGVFLPVFFKRDDAADIGVHSRDDGIGGAATGEAVIRWVAPEAGHLAIDGHLYWDQNPLDREHTYTLTFNGQLLASGRLAFDEHNGFVDRVGLNFSGLPVAVGDELTLSFVAPPSAAGTFSYTSLDLEVTPVPEPATGALMLAGVASQLTAASISAGSQAVTGGPLPCCLSSSQPTFGAL